MFWSKRPSPINESALQELQQLVLRLQKQVAQLDADMDAWGKWSKKLEDDLHTLEAQHLRLRGRVYATGAHKEEPTETGAKPVGEMSRDELRRHLFTSGRFVPGRPAKHEP